MEAIRYGYLRVEVRRDGTPEPLFREVRRDSLPLASDTEGDKLTEFCFVSNKRVGGAHDATDKPCPCGATR